MSFAGHICYFVGFVVFSCRVQFIFIYLFFIFLLFFLFIFLQYRVHPVHRLERFDKSLDSRVIEYRKLILAHSNFIAVRPKAALLFWVVVDFRCGVPLFIVIHANRNTVDSRYLEVKGTL